VKQGDDEEQWRPDRLSARAAGKREGWWGVSPSAEGFLDQIARATERVSELLSEGPRSRGDIISELGLDTQTWIGVGIYLDMVRVPPSGTWERRRADLFGLAEDWLGPSTATEADGVQHLVRRYLSAFGPAGRNDIGTFTGLAPVRLAAVLGSMKLRRFRDERGAEPLDVPRAPLPDPGTPAPVRLLPTWDATLLVHARRTQVLPEPYRSRIFHSKNPQSVPTFLVDGRVAGTWGIEGDRVRVDAFESLSRSAWRSSARRRRPRGLPA
jgi:hypothetical protein